MAEVGPYLYLAFPNYHPNTYSGTIARVDMSTEPPTMQYDWVTTGDNPCGVATDGQHLYWGSISSVQIGRSNLDGSENIPQYIVTGTGPEPWRTGTIPQYLAVGGGYIFWSSTWDKEIGRADLNGNEVKPFLIQAGGEEGKEAPFGLVVNNGSLYWAQGSAIHIATLNGENNAAFVGPGLHGAVGLAINGSYMYWTDSANYQNASGYGGSIGRVSLDGSGANEEWLTAAPLHHSGALIVDDTTLPGKGTATKKEGHGQQGKNGESDQQQDPRLKIKKVKVRGHRVVVRIALSRAAASSGRVRLTFRHRQRVKVVTLKALTGRTRLGSGSWSLRARYIPKRGSLYRSSAARRVVTV
jgi:hypothetical protein